MQKTDLMPLLNAYKQRYGSFTMEKETMAMWWDKLKDQDAEQVREAFHQLLGGHSKPFGWKHVITVIEAMYPSESPQKALEREWKKKPSLEDDLDKREILGEVMRKLINQNNYQPFDWVSAYAEKFIEVWGKQKARNICEKMANYYIEIFDGDGNVKDKQFVPMNECQTDFYNKVLAKY